MSVGYSGTPLEKKLGLKEGFTIRLINPPDHYFDLFKSFPQKIENTNDKNLLKDFIHFFTKDAAELNKEILNLKNEIHQNGMIWISWPKKASKVATDITEDVVRKIALENGLVDIKVCAVDIIWSGLKLVIPVKDRK